MALKDLQVGSVNRDETVHQEPAVFRDCPVTMDPTVEMVFQAEMVQAEVQVAKEKEADQATLELKERGAQTAWTVFPEVTDVLEVLVNEVETAITVLEEVPENLGQTGLLAEAVTVVRREHAACLVW